MTINVDAFLNTLPIMAKGMVGVFLVTVIFIVSIYILNKVFKKKS